MIGSELNESLIQTFDTCELHLKRMTFAKSKVAAPVFLGFFELKNLVLKDN